MKKFVNFLLFILLLIGFKYMSCDLPHQPGPMPNTLIQTELEVGLNIFGVLRADDQSGTSFIYVEKAVTTEEMYGDVEVCINDASVSVQEMHTTDQDTFSLSPDTSWVGYYINPEFIPAPGEHYCLSVTAPDFPELTAETTIPNKPTIDSLSIGENAISFDILPTSDTYLYKAFLSFSNDDIGKEIINDQSDQIPVKFEFSSDLGNPIAIRIIGYDQNLAEYLEASLSFLPQSFQETVRTVENGYGCFGSLAVTLILLP